MKIRRLLTILVAAAALSWALPGQSGLDPAKLLQPATDTWPMYNGDYSGRRFSTLKDINTSNVKSLALAWTYRIQPTGGRGGRISSTPLEVNGVLYFTIPNHVWAVDARTGKELWDHPWESKISAIGNRGVGIVGQTLYFETPDCNLVALDINTGKEKWHTSICSIDLMYFGSVPPMPVKNHLILGVSGDDMDIPGYVEAVDPETGDLQWRWYAHPNPGDPEAASWPNEDAMMHSGGMTWVPGTYDPELNLYYFGTGNAQPVINGSARPGANLYTGCIIALNPDTGKMAWYFQPNPHDTHDWDAVEVPILADGTFKGQPRKMLMQASRNGYFFVLDRTNGKSLLTEPFAAANWANGIDDKGQPIPNPEKEPARDGRLVSPDEGGATNYRSPSFDPKTGLFIVSADDSYGIYFYKPEDGAYGWAGADYGLLGIGKVEAIDYQTGKIKWTHPIGDGAGSGVLTTATGLTFTGDAARNFMALRTTDGTTLWHSSVGHVENSPVTYMLDGRQYVLASAGGVLFAWALPQKAH